MFIWLVVSTPLKNMKVSCDYSFQYMKKCKNEEEVLNKWEFFKVIKDAVSCLHL